MDCSISPSSRGQLRSRLLSSVTTATAVAISMLLITQQPLRTVPTSQSHPPARSHLMPLPSHMLIAGYLSPSQPMGWWDQNESRLSIRDELREPEEKGSFASLLLITMLAYSSIAVREKGKALIATHERWQKKTRHGKHFRFFIHMVSC